MALEYGQVTWRGLIEKNGLSAAQGYLRFAPLSSVHVVDSTTHFIDRRTFTLDEDGDVDDGGAPGVSLPVGWWNVDFHINGFSHPAFDFEVVAGQTVDLNDVGPIVIVDGQALAKGEKGDPGEPGPPGDGGPPSGGAGGFLSGSYPNPGVNETALAAALADDLAANSTGDRARANHTGTQSLDTTTDSATRLTMTTAERTKLGGVATGATANATDSQLRDRSTHTGTQAVSTLATTGTADGTTYLRGDGVWATPAGGSGGTVTAANITDATTVGRSVLTAADAAAARTAIGAGTSSLAIGTTGTTAAAGNDSRIVGAAQRVLTKTSIAANYTLVAADAVDKVLHSTAAAGITITLPQDSAITIAQEVAIPWRQYGAGQLTFAAGTGATLISRGSVFKSAGQNAEGTVTKVAANTWLLSGDIVA